MNYDQRAKRVRDNSFFPKTLEIHWLSIINSMVLVFLLIGFVVIILVSCFILKILDESSEEWLRLLKYLLPST